MELATVEVPAKVAREQFLAYRESLKTERDEARRREDEQLMRAYREAAKGARLVVLTEVLRAGGTHQVPARVRRYSPEHGRDMLFTEQVTVPNLAVARADVDKVWTGGIDARGGVRFDYVREDWHAAKSKERHWQIPARTFQPVEGWTRAKMVAMAPSIPPALRPKHHLRNYALLWEAEWRQDPTPPVDPALLKHVGGDLYAVLAVWDLTPLEQAVLAGTRA